MLIAAGGGGAGTVWGLMSVQDMQNLIQNPDTEKHYELLTGWKRSADLLIEHRWQVQNYRDNLAAVWPPEKNAASAAYLARLDELIANLSETYEATLANHDAFAAATLSISLAQKDMAEITREYQANEQTLADFTAKQQNASGQPQPSPAPSGEQPPVAPGRQQELHQRAVTLLSGVSADLAQAQVRIRTPRPYKSEVGRHDSIGDEVGAYTPPPIPPITPSFVVDTAPSADWKRPAVTFPASAASLPAPQPPTPQPGLVLGGAPTNPVTTVPPTAIHSPPPTISGVPNGPAPVSGFLPSAPASFSPTGNAAAQPTTGPLGRNAILPRESLIRPGSSGGGSAHVMPPGGVIGGTPGTGVARPGSTPPAAQRINPVGGMIGGAMPPGKGGGGSAPGQHAGGLSSYGQVGRGGARPDHETQGRWDPDNPWQTASGVDPVLLPSREQRLDPGPAIGLS